jgi:serine/threonine protein kinase
MQSGPPSPSPERIASERPADSVRPLPRRFGRYQLFDRIGRGGMAEIFLARAETGLGGERLVVVKQIHEALSNDPTFAAMFVEEAKLCAGLRHANVVQVLDLGREENLLYMAMEYVEGFDLHQLLARCAKARIPLPAEFAIFMVREVLAALDFAHRATDASGRPLGIVHRDVSPSNVLMSLEGEVKLCDFGIARATARETPGEAASVARARVVGKSAYMSPEHARGEHIDARADVFAAGILLWELSAGRRLYRGNEEEMLALAKRAEVPPLPDRGLPSPGVLQTILDRALAADRDARFETAAAMRSALDEYALSNRLFVSQIRFGAFLTDHIANTHLDERRQKEREARALDSVERATDRELGEVPRHRAFEREREITDADRSSPGDESDDDATELALADHARIAISAAQPVQRAGAEAAAATSGQETARSGASTRDARPARGGLVPLAVGMLALVLVLAAIAIAILR